MVRGRDVEDVVDEEVVVDDVALLLRAEGLAELLELAVEVLGVHGEAAREEADPLVERLDEALAVVAEVGLEDVDRTRLVEVLLDGVRAEHEALGDLHSALAWATWIDKVNLDPRESTVQISERLLFCAYAVK